METNYWNRVLNGRVSRRRALTATGAAGLSAAFLAACGGSDSGGSSSSSGSGSSSTGVKNDKSGLVSPTVDTSKQAKRGGTKKWYIGADVNQGWDVHIGSSAMEPIQTPSMGTLVLDKAGYLKGTDHTQEGDIAESWEFSPDKLTLTFKLRKGVKFAPIDPVNGRELDAQDVLFSWERFSKGGQGAADMVNAKNPAAPVLSVTAPDASTIVAKLKAPISYVLSLFAAHNSGHFTIFPKEADSKYEPKNKLIGTGPFYMADYKPSIGITLKRNPGYYGTDHPNIDTVEMPIVSEYAQGLAQLKAGNIYAYPVRAEDIINFKKDVPEINLYQAPFSAGSVTGHRTFFGWQPKGQSPWRDERVRQAYSMAIDRDLFIDTFFNVEKFRGQGLPVDTAYNNALTCYNWEGWWIDPVGKDMGPNSQYFKLNIAEAKKLMAAAGYSNGFETTSVILAGTEYGTLYPKQLEVIEGMVGELGIKTKHNAVDYTKVFQFQYRDVAGQFEGLSYKLGPQAAAPEATGQLVYDYHSKKSTGWYGQDVNGKGDGSGDPAVDALLDKAEAEFDIEKRKQIIYEAQRYLGKAQFGVRWPGGSTGFLVAWPALANYNVYQTDPRGPSVREWIDDTKAPLKKS
jgi:peptide/nickel transport system substrate-binding protein